MQIMRRVSDLWNNFRNYLDKKRKENKKAFDFCTKAGESLWVILSAFFPSLIENNIIVTGFLLISFFGVFLFQWAVLKNEFESQVESNEDKFNSQMMNVAQFTHSVVHGIKINIANVPYQEINFTRDALASFIKEGLNTLENNLSSKYEKTISASIKLCTKENRLKTFGRGVNNIESRGGEARVIKLDKREHSVSSNYAYNAIIKMKLKFFADGDLKNLSMKLKEKDKFYWEYSTDWSNYFRSTIVIPIRCPCFQKSGEVEEYKIVGLLCVDSHDVIPEWTNNSKSYGYELTAFFADSLYNYINKYLERQESLKLETEKN